MQVVVPLAGPDFIDSTGEIKALKYYLGQPILKFILESRPWSDSIKDYIFILIDNSSSRYLVDHHIKSWFPQARFVFLSSFTRGAACSVLAGVACQENFNNPIIVDLADIMYCSDLDVLQHFLDTPNCGALALTFRSSNPIYSYLATDSSGLFVEAAEKKVISSSASAGTYVFGDSSIYIRALAYSFKNESSQAYNGSFYVCPLFNGVKSQGLTVELKAVSNVQDPKTLF